MVASRPPASPPPASGARPAPPPPNAAPRGAGAAATALATADRINRPLVGQLRAPRASAGDPAFPQPASVTITIRTVP